MKVLITTDWYAPTVNGVVTSVLNLKRELEGMGHEVRVLTLSQNAHSFCKDGVTFLGSIGVGRIYPGARVRSALAGSLVSEIVKWRPDIIHSQCEFSTYLLARSIASKLGIPVVHTYHTVYEDYTHYFSPSKRGGRFMVKHFTRFIVRDAQCVIAPTEKVRALLEKYKVKPEVCVVPSGIDLNRFTAEASPARTAEIKAKYNIKGDTKVLLYVGRLAEEKNVAELFDEVKACEKRNIVLLMAGDGPYRAQLEKKAQELCIEDKVIFAGMIPPAEIADYYKMADIFVSASTSETQGLTYVEALASGLPCLCRQDPCLNGLVQNGVNGWQYQTKQQFSNYLNAFLTGDMSHMKRRAKLSAAPYSSTAFAKKAEAIYRRHIRIAHIQESMNFTEEIWTRA